VLEVRFPRNIIITAAYLNLVSNANLFTTANTCAALPKNTSCTFAPVALDTTTENRITKTEATTAIIALLIGTKKRRYTGMRRRSTARDTSRILARILSFSRE
jgi:hypothetical protein